MNAIDYANGGKYRSIVKIQMCFNTPTGEQWMMGTGWLVNEDTLVTAGHVVYDRAYGFGACIQVKCYIGYEGVDSVNAPNSGVQARYGHHVITTEKWAQPSPSGLQDRPFDVAFIRVHKPFEGQLNVFKYIETAPSATAIVGVIGYPGDKALGDEKGAHMYGEFAKTTYNVETDKQHMITYQLSTYGGQSGAPIIARTASGLVAIGTHCYGAGIGIQANSGNSIGGKWGNAYDKFLSLFRRSNAFASRPNQSLTVSLDIVGPPLPVPVPTPTPIRPDPFIPSIPSYPGDPYSEEGFLDTFRKIAKIGSGVISIGAPFLGPIGAIVGPVAGGLLSAIAGQESVITAVINRSGDPIAPGIAERAVLAEASLQGLFNVYEKDPNNAVLKMVLSDMSKEYLDHAPNVDEIATALTPQLMECALDLASYKYGRATIALSNPWDNHESTLERRPLMDSASEAELGGSQEAFVGGLLSATLPVPGAEEGAFDFLGPLIKDAIRVAKPLVSRGAKYALTNILPHLLSNAGTEASFDSAVTMTPATQTGAKLVFQRALMADAALTVLRKLPQTQLDQLTVTHGESHTESQTEAIFDYIKSAVQKIGPSALAAAKGAIKNLVPTLVDAVASQLKEKLGVPTVKSASPHESVRTLKRQVSTASINGSRLMAPSDGVESGPSAPPSPRAEFKAFLEQPSVSYHMNPDQPPFTKFTADFDA
ncbi:hypothetical protein ONZ45_g11253 [Pleurotus djamor]|nr:hypothetical protein ONZ45_g11253 [Pleurotus djamor]